MFGALSLGPLRRSTATVVVVGKSMGIPLGSLWKPGANGLVVGNSGKAHNQQQKLGCRYVSCSSVDAMSRRDKLYGVEEGHGHKNEVRKERWWSKKNPPMRGSDWREQQCLEHDALPKGIFARQPDWRHPDGEPGALTVKQERYKEAELQLIADIYEAAQVTLKAKEFESKKNNG